MGNTNEGSQQGKEPTETNGHSQNVGSTSDEDSPQEVSGGTDVTCEAEGSVSSRGTETVAECLNCELESMIEADFEADEKPQDVVAGFSVVAPDLHTNDENGNIADSRDVGIWVSEVENVQKTVSESHESSSKTFSLGDKEDYRDRHFGSQISGKWRDSIASSITDNSEMYQTAAEDSDNDGVYNEDSDDDEDDEELRKTLCASQLQENIAHANATGNVALVGEDKVGAVLEREPDIELGNVELVGVSEGMAYKKGLFFKATSTVTDEEEEEADVEIEKLQEFPSPSECLEGLDQSDPAKQALNNLREEIVAEEHNMRKDYADVDRKKVDKGFDIGRSQTDAENFNLQNVISFESKVCVDTSQDDDAKVSLELSSVSPTHKSLVCSENLEEYTTEYAEQDSDVGHMEQFSDDQESPAETDALHHKERDMNETNTETTCGAEELSAVRMIAIQAHNDDYDATDGRIDDAILSSPRFNEHSVFTGCDADPDNKGIVSVEDDLHSEHSENEVDEGQLKLLEVGDIVSTKDELVCAEEVSDDNEHRLLSSDHNSLVSGHDNIVLPSDQKETVTHQTADLSGAREMSSDECDSGSPLCRSLEPDAELVEDSPSSSGSQEQEQYSMSVLADNSFSDILPSTNEAISIPKSDEAFISNTQEPRTKTTDDEALSAEQTALDADVDFDVVYRMEISSASLKPGHEETDEEKEAEFVSDRRSGSRRLVSMAAVDDEDEVEATGGSISAAENLLWFGDEEEPEPDYSLSSDDDQADDAKPDIKEVSYVQSTVTVCISSEHPVADVDSDTPPPDYLESVEITKLQNFSVASAEHVSPTDTNAQNFEQIPENNETVNSRTDDFDSCDDDEDSKVPLGNFQRRSSIRPSKRGPVKIKRSVIIPPSWSEHPEEEIDANVDTPGSETVFLPFGTETSATRRPTGYDRGPVSVPVLTKDHEKELWSRSSQVSSRTMTTRSDGSLFHRSRFQQLERKNATKTSKPGEPSEGREWTKYEVVMRKDQGGFGMTLSRSSPVVVCKVPENGVAARNGIREGDRIHKVNGSLVANCSHDEVVDLIKSSGLFVVLVLQRPSSEIGEQPVPVTPSITDNIRVSSPLKSSSWSSPRNVAGLPLIPMHVSSPPEIPDVAYDVVPTPFTDINVLKQKPAHLAVFLNYLLTEGKPNAMLFTLIADYYQNSLKESNNSAKRWAYEIYSTFLMSSAPLRLKVDDGMEASVEKTLRRSSTNGLWSLFVPITNFVRNEIVCQLKQFATAWKSDYSLRAMNVDRQVELQVIEGALWRHFERCLTEERNDAKHAIAYSLATFFRQIGYGGARNSSLLDNCPTFMSKDKKALKNNMKKHFLHKGHQFSPRQFAAVTHCQICQKVIWGLGHQAYHCSSCDVSIHRHCTEKIVDVCSRTKDSKRSMRDMIPGRKLQNSMKDELQKSFFLPPFMTDPDDLRNLPSTPVERSNGPDHDRLHFPDFTTERGGRSPSRLYSRRVCISDDSDLEVDSELPQLTDFIPKEDFRQMKEKEKKRQQIINELFHTERVHVRTLKVMDRVFFRPMQDESYINQEFVSLLFPNLQDLIQIHDGLKKEFLALRKEKTIVDEVGLLLVNRFSGPHGEKFREACATFCADQAYALDVLRTKQKKDPRYSTFLQEAAANSLCKRQELKDFLPRQMQRLTKYPLLIDSLRKITPPNTEEHNHLTNALGLSKGLLEHVNQVVKSIQNQRHLADMQQRLDWRSNDTSGLSEYKNLNLTEHSLVYDGLVTWRPYRSRPIELHMVLFEDILVLLQKQDDRLVLRYQMTTVEDTKFPYCPIIGLSRLMIRDVATDKRAFFVIDSVSPQVYDLLAYSREEKNKWCNYIKDTIERHGLSKGSRLRSATQVIDLVSYGKGARSPALAGDAELRPNQDKDARSGSCHALASYDSPDQSASGINLQQVIISRMTTTDSDSAAKLSNMDECDNVVKYGNKDECGSVVKSPESETTVYELARRLEELISYINRLMREKLKLASQDLNAQCRDDDGQFRGSHVLTMDTKELLSTALVYVNNLMELINEQLGDMAASDWSDAEDKKIAVPAEDLLNISAALQHLTAQLAISVTTDDPELERLENDVQVALDDFKEKSSAFQLTPSVDRHPSDLSSSFSCTNDVTSTSEEIAPFSAAKQTNIYTVGDQGQLTTSYDCHDQHDSSSPDLPTEENRMAALVGQD